ncbi:MAG: hypothetical protein V3V02_10230 [Rhizobiaceae bacterium]
MASLYNEKDMRAVLGSYRIGTSDDLNKEGYLRIVRARRRQLGQMTTALDTESAKRRIPDSTYQISRKVDGEFAMLIYEDGEACIINPGKTVRAGAPFLDEAIEWLNKAGVKKALIGGEFYVQRTKEQLERDGKATRVHDIVRFGRAPKTQDELNQLAFACFNIYDLDGEDLSMNYDASIAKLEELFSKGKRIHPVETVVGENAKAVLKQYEKWVRGEGEEGVVARSPTAGVYKLKPRHNLDLAVIGFTESTDDRKGMLHDMLLAIVRQDGSYQIVTRVGGGFSDEQRFEFLEKLKTRVVESGFHEVNSARVAYQMVEPGLVVEIQCLDLVATTSRGNPIDKMVLEWDADENRWEGLRRLPLCSVISPQFVRFREDKQAQKDDVRLAQLSDIVNIPDIERVAEQIKLPPSKLIKRTVGTKNSRGAVMVRKLVMWKTNKDEASKDFPAYVLQLTDFSPNRKDPLKYEMKVSSSKEQLLGFFAEWEKKYYVSGWVVED